MNSTNEHTYIFESAMEEKTKPEALVSEKFYIDLNDSNSSNYTNQQLIFDLPSLALADGYISLHESVLRIPLQTTIKSSAEILKAASVHKMVALKGTTSSIIDSFQLNVDNFPVKTFSSHNEIPTYFKKITSMSKDYETVATGISNFDLDGGVGTYTAVLGEHYIGNDAVAFKNSKINDIRDGAGVAGSAFQDESTIKTSLKSHFVVEDANTVTYNYLLEIPLSDIDELFSQIPLSRGLYMRLMMQMHMGVVFFYFHCWSNYCFKINNNLWCFTTLR